MPYQLPAAVDSHLKMFSVPAAQIPTGVGGGSGLPFIQYNTHRIELRLQNVAAAGSFVWVSSKENGFVDAYRINGGESLTLEFPPRTPLYVWTTGTAPDFRYAETVYEPYRSSIGQDGARSIRSNVGTP